jgi:hypothetical protein
LLPTTALHIQEFYRTAQTPQWSRSEKGLF